MSPKELLYIEDALDHMCENKKCCADFASQVQDPSLRNLLQDISCKQTETFQKFYSLLNG
ncbi:MAG: hypothetical protein IJ021_07570 [Clostridia bacterium]|nr:hypothetical protein [Clostridia bacterium]